MALWFTTDWRDFSLDMRARALGLERDDDEHDRWLERRVEREAFRRSRPVRQRERSPSEHRKHFDARRSQACASCGSWHAPILACDQAAKGWGVSDVCDD